MTEEERPHAGAREQLCPLYSQDGLPGTGLPDDNHALAPKHCVPQSRLALGPLNLAPRLTLQSVFGESNLSGENDGEVSRRLTRRMMRSTSSSLSETRVFHRFITRRTAASTDSRSRQSSTMSRGASGPSAPSTMQSGNATA